ncbi:protein-glutamine gamma-glutamyltransferase K-like [Montipora foliosa]|uniref:protein-glutamine gamma-glutamyltransferase K-like n=1 Tax=Montipora foliosa TaxID=591990 RepID=UPI0035F14B8C
MSRQTGCFGCLRGKSDHRVEPEGAHSRGGQNGAGASVEPHSQPQPQPQPQTQPKPQPADSPPDPLPEPRLQPQPDPPTRTTADTVSAGVETSNGESTSNTCNRSRLGEGEGRRNPVSDADFRNNSINLKPDVNSTENVGQLKTTTVDLLVEENKKDHKTDGYEIEQLIIRRGKVFDVTVTFDRDYNPGDDVILVQLATGKRPQESKGSLTRVSIQESLTPVAWGMQIKEAGGNTVRLSIMPPANAITGQYEIFIETKSKNSSGEILTYRYKHEEQFYILFNAWCAEDAVYMDSEEEREEYVLENLGYIWRGTSYYKSKLAWKFGQFDDVALYTALWLLDKAELPTVARANPIEITRTISAMANSNSGDGGILTGRWSNTYPGGTRPTAWSGSTEILEQFWETKKSVKYAQCWVFSGLVTTLMRALGIPTRSVTNFDSAHDIDKSLTIDYHFDQEGEVIDWRNDSVWNYHVWNESWFKRPDLPDGHNGWQIHDATPQELSNGVFRCGPASVNAVKNGEVFLPYDTGFVFAEVNGDIVYWLVNPDGSMTKTSKQKNAIGFYISTKAVGAPEREDLTLDYKHSEGSEEERRAVRLAFNFSSRKEHEIYVEPKHEDIHFHLEAGDSVYVGNSFDATVVVRSESEETREILVNLTAIMSFYTGVTAKKLKSYKQKFPLKAQEEKRLTLTIELDDYIAWLNACESIKFYVKGTVTETKQSFATHKDVELEKPSLTVTASESEVSVGQDVTITATVKNPLPIPLTEGQFHLEAIGMKPRTLVIDLQDPVGANEDVNMDAAKFTATKRGRHDVTVSFQSKELMDVHGTCTVSGIST